MRLLAALLAGLVFGVGLILSGMTNPAKVQNFLDVFGAPDGRWDPSLAFVMGGAIVIATAGFAWLRGVGAPLFADTFRWPTRNDIDAPLLGGAALFGIGWGLGGLCPGPALTALPSRDGGILLFVAAMLAGFVLARFWRARGERVAGSHDGNRTPTT